MNLTALLRNHPDLALFLDDAREYLVQCGDCPHHFPPDQLSHGGDRLLCSPCFDRRQEFAVAEWHERRAEESREVTA